MMATTSKKNIQIILFSVLLTGAVFAIYTFSTGFFSNYTGSILLVAAGLSLVMAYRFLLAYLGKQEIKEMKTNYAELKNLDDPNVSGTVPLMFSLPREEHVTITIRNMDDEDVLVMADQSYPEGEHVLTLDSTQLDNGIYYYQMLANKYRSSKKMVIRNK